VKIIILILIFSFTSKAQFIDPFKYFSFDYSANKPHYYPIGNLGFDTKLNSYNPNFVKSASTFFIQASLFLNVKQSLLENDQLIFKEKISVYPNGIFQYQQSWFAIQLSYINTVASSLKSTDVLTEDLLIPASNSILQISFIFKLQESLSITGGVLTNRFETKLDLLDNGYVRYYMNLFDNFQFTLGLNYSLKEFFNAYLVFRSESSDEKLMGEHSVNSNVYPIPNIYFNGLIGAGIRFAVLHNLGISLETNHDFVEYKKIYRQFNSVDIQIENIFNTRIITGVNYRPIESVKFGILFSKYTVYKNPSFFRGYEREVKTTPYALNFGVSYQYQNIDFNLMYQFSEVEFKAIGYEFTETENSHYIGLGIGLELF